MKKAKKLSWQAKRKMEMVKDMIASNDVLSDLVRPFGSSIEPTTVELSGADWCRVHNALVTRRMELLGWLGEYSQEECGKYWLSRVTALYPPKAA